jgi:hypothetical protein
MSSVPNTPLILQAVQYALFTNIKIGGVSPFTAWNTSPNPANPGSVSDLTRFGTNPLGTVSNALYIGAPKEMNTLYSTQCHIIPTMDETVVRRAFGGKVWHERWIYFRVVMNNTTDWYGTQTNIITLADVIHPYLMQHAELPNAPAVIASKEMARGGMPIGYHRDEIVGREWDCWGFVWWFREEYAVSGGFVT